VLRVHRLGSRAYSVALPMQTALNAAVRKQRPPDDFLILVEHTPVITLGRSWKGGNILADPQRLRELGFEVHEVTRGGDVTYHGPGQLVAYPIFDLNRHGKDIHVFLSNLEQTAIEVLSTYGLKGERKEGMTGAWVADSKVCAIGVAISGWVSYHGLAFNVDPDLSHFRLIVPCGISKYPVASLKTFLGSAPPMREVEQRFVAAFQTVFGITDVKEFDDSQKDRLSCMDEEGRLTY